MSGAWHRTWLPRTCQVPGTGQRSGGHVSSRRLGRRSACDENTPNARPSGRSAAALREARSAELEQLARSLGVDAVLGDAVPRSAIPALFARADLLINATHGASADKVVYEAAASCVPVLAASPAFGDLLPAELRFDFDRPDALAERLVGLDPRRRPELREIVTARHSVEHWADAVVATVGRR